MPPNDRVVVLRERGARGDKPSLGSVLRLTESGLPVDGGPDILDMLNQAEQSRLMGAGHERRYRTDGFFFRQGDAHDGIHFITEGRVRSFYVSPSGREITLAYWPKGHFVGAPQVLGGGEHMWSSIAVEPSAGLWLPGRVLRELIREIPNLAIALIEGLTYKGMCYTALLQIMGTQSKTARLGHLLLTLASPAAQAANVADVSQRFTQEELANLIGATRQSISTSLDKFEKQRLIERNGDAIRIVDVGGLRAFCD